LPLFHHKSQLSDARKPSGPATSQPSSAKASASSISARQQAAEGLAGLLQQSVEDRSAIAQAVNDVDQCGPNLNQDPQTFNAAASSRQNLLTELADLPGRSALSPDMLAALTSAWQNSITADRDFAQWAQDEISRGCTQNDQSDPGAQAAVGPDDQATTSKQTFVSLWNPVAAQYGLPSYQWNQL
jgi:hypothetical protein